MAQLLALYHQPKDPTAFEQHYYGTHVPLAKQLPGLRTYTVSKGPLVAAAGDPPYYLVAVLTFDSMAAIQAALASPQGEAAVADVAVVATGGATILMYDTHEV
jgi:uncharacterized protein (TIGR02118 family)